MNLTDVFVSAAENVLPFVKPTSKPGHAYESMVSQLQIAIQYIFRNVLRKDSVPTNGPVIRQQQKCESSPLNCGFEFIFFILRITSLLQRNLQMLQATSQTPAMLS